MVTKIKTLNHRKVYQRVSQHDPTFIIQDPDTDMLTKYMLSDMTMLRMTMQASQGSGKI